ncbi:peptidase C25 [Marixanthomonas spongiae]|uniref:Peptidase C25 n=2 Tax=Marixanthomonas spongiae TaxID=2174845 RepID=A0A2U0HWQ1_9FLAO|nr:peptidase C25 [Marixanthomonas spongiae]
MKKTILLISFVLLPFVIWAQTKNITINWEGASKTATSVSAIKQASANKQPGYDPLKLNIDEDHLVYHDQWRDTGFADENSIEISNVSYGTLTRQELQKINKALVPEELTYSIHSSKARDEIYTAISLSPVVRVNGRLQKVQSFTVSYKKDMQNKGASFRMPLANSVLADGDWYKFKVEETGVHRIDKSFLDNLGMNTSNINPQNLKIYGHGGKPLPLYNALNTQFDLPETSIKVVGGDDGSFDSGDYILFYGTSTKGYDPENQTNLNPYSDESYYYITADGGPGKRIQQMVEPTGAPTTTITTFQDYKYHEVDEFSPSKLGRRWFGNRFDIESEQSYEFTFPNIVSGSTMQVVVKAGAVSESRTSMAISVNGVSLDPLSFRAVTEGTVLIVDELSGSKGEVPAAGETVTVDLAYNNGGNPSSVGYLDYVSVEAIRQLTVADGQLAFRYKPASNLSGIGEYQVGNTGQVSEIWDVTDPGFISAKQNENNAPALTFKAVMGTARKYVAVHTGDYRTPVQISDPRVFNQNLKGSVFKGPSGAFQDVDYLIVTAPFLLQPALRLANLHKTQSGLNVKVVTTDKIYQEFSSGKQDIGAIRNFVRYIYNNASSADNRIKYLCLFGDTSVDYKNRLSGNNNIVPTFHTLSSVNESSSFMSDDFFGNMDPDEGTIGGNTLDASGERLIDTDMLDIAVGRVLADEVGLANAMVDKIIAYTSKESYGNWRNNFMLISDDVDKSGEQRLEIELDALGDEISAEKPFINVKKIHIDAYKQETSSGGNRYPKVNEAIKNNIEVGALVVNYFGHGGEDGLAHEYIYTKGMATSLKNKNKTSCVVTITCQFTKFDNPQRVTAGELTYWNKEGGAISLLTTTRSIGLTTGVNFNKKLATHLFGYDLNVPKTPAEALRLAKRDLGVGTRLRRVVFYIGDPAMHLAFPKKNVRLTTINGVPVGQSPEVLKALDKVKMTGEVTDENRNLLTNYSGVLSAKVFDKRVQRQTLDNDNQGFVLDFTTLGETLFNGKATVENGIFEFEFVMPRDIQIPVGTGRVNFYTEKNNALEDQAGVDLSVQIGGINENAPEDNQGPTINLFMNDESFVSGGVTNASPILIAKLEDENGINTASGIGHDMVAILDGDESNPIVVNDYYQAEQDDYTKGTANYRLRDLEKGLHTLTFKAWDVYNNSSTAEIQFIVAGDDELKITKVLNYPNPFVDYTEFWFNHNRPFEPLEVQVQVFTVTGKVVWSKNQIINTDGFLSRDIVWDGRDDFGDKIGKGVYVYKITVKSTLTNKQTEKFEKLVIL